jgi:hypothetical protein
MAMSVQYSNPLPTAGVYLQKIKAVGKKQRKEKPISHGEWYGTCNCCKHESKARSIL